MVLIIRKVLFLVGLTLFVISAHSQIVTSARDGAWTDPTTWLGGVIPASVNATQIIINHEVELRGSFSVIHLVVNNKLRLDSGAVLSILADAMPDVSDLQIYGELICEDQAVLNGTSVLNTRFEAGSSYVHRQGPLGFIPFATWDRNSTFYIEGFTSSGYINVAHSESWKQAFGNVVYDCPDQVIFVVDLNGYLQNINGNFSVLNTNNNILRLSTTQNFALNVGGSMVISGPSEIWFSTNAADPQVTIQQDLEYRSASTGPSYLTTRGVMTLDIMGNFELDSPGAIRMTSSAPDSLGIRMSSLNIGGNITLLQGVLIAAPPGNGKGRIRFNGTGIQEVIASPLGSNFRGDMDYIVDERSIVNLGYSALSSDAGLLQVKGTLQLGSADPAGAIQTGNGGNIRIPGPRLFEEGSAIEYNGTTTQRIGSGHPTSAGVDLICNNPGGVTLLQDISVTGNFELRQGSFSASSFELSVQGDLRLDENAAFTATTTRLTGSNNQLLSANAHALKNITLSKSGNSAVTLISPLKIEGIISIETLNTTLHSDGYLTLISSSDDGSDETCVGPLPTGSRITGSVTVQRYMRGKGRIYRYISSAVEKADISMLMDDFPVTGSFADPSTGPGISSTAPSLYRYDQSRGGLQEGWIPYPLTGRSDVNLLDPGRGYAAFIRNGTDATTWDVTGILNQGEITLPVDFTAENHPSNGWNLVGNPYACPIDWDVGFFRRNISPIVSIRDNGVAGGVFKYWDGDVNYSDIPDGHIAAGQAMWVRATGVDPELKVSEAAKTTTGSAFYRGLTNAIPSFALTLENDRYVDKVYFKVRPVAGPGIDEWDAIKLENDKFDISIPSREGIPLAIHTRGTVPCGKEIIPVMVKDLEQGRYKLSLIAKHDMKNYTYTWIDNYSKQETSLLLERSLEFTVTSDPASFATDRFAIQVVEIPIRDENLKVVSDSLICPDERLSVLIQNSQTDVYYSIWEGEHRISDEISGGGSLEFTISPDSLLNGNNKLSIQGRSACSQRFLKPQIEIIKERTPDLQARSSRACAGDSVLLSASSNFPDLSYSWFEGEHSSDTIATTSEWFTPVLTRPRTYYVCGNTAAGCTSSRMPVTAEITQYAHAIIKMVDDNVLVSNYAFQNSWYLNGVKLEGKNSQTLEVTGPGTYLLEVDTSGCLTRDSLELLVVGTTGAVMQERFEVYPNPAGDHLLLKSPVDGPVAVEISNVTGVTVWKDSKIMRSSEPRTLDIGFLKEGSYFIRMIYKTAETVVHFIKNH